VSERRQALDIEVQARRRGETLFIVKNTDLTLYTATVDGDLPCLSGGCGEESMCHANLCATESSCLVARDATCCAVDADCDDADACTGAGTCDAGRCRPGARVGCVPNGPCTPAELRCSATVVRRLFDDWLACEALGCGCDLEARLLGIERRIQSALDAGRKTCARRLRGTARRVRSLGQRATRSDSLGCHAGASRGSPLWEELFALRRSAKRLARAGCEG
jgi:hypothetical protein